MNMYKGKELCNTLKSIRKEIADANGIAYNPTECKHEGECNGTCPKCESEVRYIENQLSRLKSAGKALKIVGMATGLSAMSLGMAGCGDPLEGDVDVRNFNEFRFVNESGHDIEIQLRKGSKMVIPKDSVFSYKEDFLHINKSAQLVFDDTLKVEFSMIDDQVLFEDKDVNFMYGPAYMLETEEKYGAYYCCRTYTFTQEDYNYALSKARK